MLRKPTCPKKMRETDHRFPEVLYKLTVFFGSLRLRSRVNQDRWKLFTEAFGDSSMLGQFWRKLEVVHVNGKMWFY